MEENKKKKSKKLVWVIGIVLILFVGMLVLGSSDSDDTDGEVETAAVEEAEEKEVAAGKEDTTAVEVAEPEPEEPVVEEAVPEPEEQPQQVSSNYVQIGDEYTNGDKTTTLKFLNVEYMQDKGVVCVNAEVTNNSTTEEYNVSQKTNIYVDGYQFISISFDDLSEFTDEMTEWDMGIRLSPGRKCNYTFFAFLPEEANTGSTVEFEIYNLPVLLKENGEWIDYSEGADAAETVSEESELSGMTAIAAHDGVYICSDDSNAVITISDNGTKATSQYTTDYDFVDLPIEDNGNYSYSVYIGDEETTLIFFDGGGLSVGGGVIGGWFDMAE